MSTTHDGGHEAPEPRRRGLGAAESIASWAVDHPDVPLTRVADHLMTVLWPVVRELPG